MKQIITKSFFFILLFSTVNCGFKVINETERNDFSIQEINQLLSSHFNITGKTTPLVSDRDQNVLVREENGKMYILKISNPDEQRGVLDMQDKATQCIQSNDPDLNVPTQVGKINKVVKEEVTYFVRVLEYIDGFFMKDQSLDNSAYQKLGSFLGRIDWALSKFNHIAADRSFPWDVRSIDLINGRLQYLNNRTDQRTVNHFLTEYESKVMPYEKNLRKMIIHNDGNDHNVLVNENGDTIGIIDFGDMVYSYQVAEPAVSMAYIAIEADDPISSMEQVIKGYHDVNPLTNTEIRSALYLVCIRLCISVTMAAWRMQLFPENRYLSVSQKPAWHFLKKIEKNNLEALSNTIVESLK